MFFITVKERLEKGWSDPYTLELDAEGAAKILHQTHLIEMRKGETTEERINVGELFYISWYFTSNDDLEDLFDQLVKLNS